MSSGFFDSVDPGVYDLATVGAGSSGALPVTDAMLREQPSGDLFGWTMDAAIVLRRLIRSLPTARGVIGVATCDKGHPAMMMALAGCADLPAVLVPGGVTLPARGAEDAGTVQSLGARYVHGLVTLDAAADRARSNQAMWWSWRAAALWAQGWRKRTS
jgi:hypothetical protein